jgi:hypothetical protein
MKKVVLLGDSIRMVGYGPLVPAMLGGEYTVYQPEDNCRFVKYTLRGLFEWRDEIAGADIIHWNNGLWDTSTGLFDDGGKPFTCEEEYVSNMLRVAQELKKIAPRVIFATTTPVRPDYEYNDNGVINRYNAVLVPLLRDMGLEINDLHALVEPHISEYIREDDKLHLTEAGAKACAEQVVKAILGEL